jgi:hypothetical protein
MIDPAGRPAALALALLVVVAGCTSGGGPAGSGGTTGATGSSGSATELPAATGSTPTAVPVPSSPGGSGAGDAPAGGAGSQPNPGSGGLVPLDPGGTGGEGPRPTLVTPVAGLLDIHPVGAVALEPSVDGRHVSVRVSWWSGVEPCSTLAAVDVARDGKIVTLTVHEGAARRDVACIDIAVYKATIVDLGELDPGDYTIAAFGEAAPVAVTVAG